MFHEEVESGKLQLLCHEDTFGPFYSYMLIKEKKWLAPAVEAFAGFVLEEMDKTLVSE